MSVIVNQIGSAGLTPVNVYESLSGGGGGGGTTYAWATESFTQTTAFTSGSVVLTLAHTPADSDSVFVDYNGRLLSATEFSVTGGSVTILIADPDVPFYDSEPYFQVKYVYEP